MTWDATIDKCGKITGQGNGGTFTVSGNVDASGNMVFGATNRGTTKTADFVGTIDAQGRMTGTWHDASGNSGSFSGHRTGAAGAGGSTAGTGGAGGATGGAGGGTGGASSSTGGAGGGTGGAGGGTGGAGGSTGGAGGASGAGAAGGTGGADGATVCTATCPAGVFGHCTCAQYPQYAGFTLKLVEEFDVPLDLVNDPYWTYSDGFGYHDYTRYAKEAITFSNGKAVITATKPTGGVAGAGYPTYANGIASQYPAIRAVTSTVQSGELRSKYNNWRYGRFEARMKAPKNTNLIATFSTFRSPSWQEWRLLDVEVTPAGAATSVGTNLVNGNNKPTYDGTFSSYLAVPVPTLAGSATIYDDFHDYALENTPNKATWYVDGAVVRTETGSGIKLPEKAMKIIFQLWVFPDDAWGGGNPINNTYPMSTEIDWVRLYKLDTDSTYPCSPLPACQPVEDKDYQKNNAEDGLPAAMPW
jgi:beta-glucanase (GH16 family)